MRPILQFQDDVHPVNLTFDRLNYDAYRSCMGPTYSLGRGYM